MALAAAPYPPGHHYAVYLRGDTPLTNRLLTPGTGGRSAPAASPRRAHALVRQALPLSQPLHFGDYGGLPLKVLWALLDVVTIVVLGSGVYLWLSRRRSPLEERLAEIESGGATEALRPPKAART